MKTLGIDAGDFAGHYSSLYHMAQDGAWDSIRCHGLLSTSALLDLNQVDGDLRRQIESCHRPTSVEIRHPGQSLRYNPRSESNARTSVAKTLRNMTPREWYELLNRKVFFWVTEERVQQLLGARMYRNRAHTVITLDQCAMGHEPSRSEPRRGSSSIRRPRS